MRLETEQMAAVYGGQADHRQGSARRLPTAEGMEVEHTARIETGAPIPAMTLAAISESIPAHADVMVTAITGGHQNDPQVTGYRIVATWRSKA